MPRRTLDRAMLVPIACAVLLSMAPVTAGAWIERMTGTIGAGSPGSRPVVIEALKHGGERAVSGAQDMSIPLCITGVILGYPWGSCWAPVCCGGGRAIRRGSVTWTGSPRNAKYCSGRLIKGKINVRKGCGALPFHVWA
jgi:hypothetical protein